MAHYIDNNRIVFNNALTIQDRNQFDDYVLTSDANGVVSWQNQASLVSQKAYDHYVGEWFGGGVVVSVWREGDREKCLVAAPSICSSIATVRYQDGPFAWFDEFYLNFVTPWSNVGNTQSGASYSTFGASNSSIIVNQPGFETTINPFVNNQTNLVSGFSGAALWAATYINPDLGTGVFDDWYLPAAHEMRALWNNVSIFNRVLYEYSAYNSVSRSPDFLNYNNSQINPNEDGGFGSLDYWTSTEASNSSAYYMADDGSLRVGQKTNGPSGGTTDYKLVRPFRIAQDNEISFSFDADYIILTYVYPDGEDLDSYTKMVVPDSAAVPSITPWNERNAYVLGSNGGPFSSNYVGTRSLRPWITVADNKVFDFTPGATTSNSPPAGYYTAVRESGTPGLPIYAGNNPQGTYSVLLLAGDTAFAGSSGLGGKPISYETVLVNLNAFRFHYPGQETIVLDCLANWYFDKGVLPVKVKVDLYKGGSPVVNGPKFSSSFIWENPSASSVKSLDSFSTVVTTGMPTTYTGVIADKYVDATRIAKLQYNINSKIGKITPN